MVRRWWLVIALGVAALATSGYALRERRLHVLAPTSVTPEPFAARGWHSGSATRRIAMAQHMAETGELAGLSRADLVTRLGLPATDDSYRLEWFLGERESAASMMFPYREHLSVLLDDAGFCARAGVSTRD